MAEVSPHLAKKIAESTIIFRDFNISSQQNTKSVDRNSTQIQKIWATQSTGLIIL